VTATERKLTSGDESVLFSMDDNVTDYGARFYTMSFKEAIERDIITDYRIVTYFAKESEIEELIKGNKLLSLDAGLDPVAARDVATAVVTKRAMEQYGIKHPLVFNRSIIASKAFRSQQVLLNSCAVGPVSENFHVDSTMSAGRRQDLLDQFIQAPIAVMSNARCLTEGVDVPGIDAVVFAAPKQSTVDIVQASGRSLRKAERKEFGYFVIPIIVPDDMSFDEFAESTEFKTILKILAAMSTQDNRIVEELRARFSGPNAKSSKHREPIIKIGGEVPVGMQMSPDRFADAIETKIWQGVARGKSRPFEEARAFARNLELNNFKEWVDYCKSEGKPRDIPVAADRTYANVGWVSWGDWLGTGNRHKGGWRAFEDARAFVRSLGLKGLKEWKSYRKSEEMPGDIPAAPNTVYADAGWVNLGDWLGTGRSRGDFDLSKRLGPLRRVSSSKAGRNGRTTARREKSPPTSRMPLTRFTPMPAG